MTTTINRVPELVELEITHACQLTCTHCLTESHPGAGHGSMTLEDWRHAVRQAYAEGAKTIQLIGGEPTASQHFTPLLEYVLAATEMRVQVYSNLYSIPERLWAAFTDPRVTLATSYYSDIPALHDRVTGKTGSHTRTRAAIVEALRRGIPIQVAIIRVFDGQRADQAKAELLSLGIPENLIKVDRARAVGRANPRPGTDAPASELCGKCGDGRLAILPDGTVAPCVLGRGLRAGNLLNEGSTLAGILAGPAWAEHMRAVPRTPGRGCTPDDSNDCDPANTTACAPAYNEYAPPMFPTIRLRATEA